MSASVNVHVSDEKLKELLKNEGFLEFQLTDDKPKIVCLLSGHEMPCRLDAVLAHVNGKKFNRLKQTKIFNYDQYKPHLVSSTKKWHDNHLFCKLTLRHINKTPDDVLRHVRGRRYQKALKRYEECQKLGVEFRPRARFRSQKDHEGTADASKSQQRNTDTESSDSDDDSMSDLYPHDMLGEPTGNSDAENLDDYDFSVMSLNDTDDDSLKQPENARGCKRKNNEFVTKKQEKRESLHKKKKARTHSTEEGNELQSTMKMKKKRRSETT